MFNKSVTSGYKTCSLLLAIVRGTVDNFLIGYTHTIMHTYIHTYTYHLANRGWSVLKNMVSHFSVPPQHTSQYTLPEKTDQTHRHRENPNSVIGRKF